MTLVERILELSKECLMCDHSKELREIALEVSRKEYRIIHLGEENSELRHRIHDDMEYVSNLSERNQRYLDVMLKHKAENERLTAKIQELYTRAEELKQSIKQLRESGDAMMSEPCEYTFEQWIKNKEAKP